MTKTYAQLQKQIAKLQQEADAIKVKEVAGVIARIQEAIQHYGLNTDDLFSTPLARKVRGAKAVMSARPPRTWRSARRKAEPRIAAEVAPIGRLPDRLKPTQASFGTRNQPETELATSMGTRSAWSWDAR